MGNVVVSKNVGGITGLTVIETKCHEDSRGYLLETFNSYELSEVGIISNFVQDNEIYSHKSVIRGFHVNINHPQAKLIRVLDGEIYDVVIDLRRNSNTFKKWYGMVLTSENMKQLYIPEGFAHGFLALTDCRVLFKVTTHYIPGDELSFSWNSKEFAINWSVDSPIQNNNDKNSPDFSEIAFMFL